MESSPGEDSFAASAAQQSQGRATCDACKRMKIKCEKRGDKCGRCHARRLDCVITKPEKRRPKPKLDRKDYIDQMESRIKRMESLLTASGVTSESPAIQPIVDKIQSQAALVDQLSTLVIDGKGVSQFIGSSSGFSLFSPQGLEWISERTASVELNRIISALQGSKYGRTTGSHLDLWHSLQPEEREPLPPKHLGILYVASFFDTFNAIFPIFNREEFMALFEAEYAGKGPKGPSWYAALFTVISMGSTIISTHEKVQIMKNPSTLVLLDSQGPNQEKGWKYFRNASSVLTDMLFRDTGIMSVQAMVLMCFMLNATVDPNSCYVLSSIVARAAHGIGLHRNLKRVGLSAGDIETRRNVYWVIYIIEKSISLRSGRPSVINDDDIGVELPNMPENSSAQANSSNQSPKIFRYQVNLALLESRIYMELYSAKSRLKSQEDRLKSIAQLDKDLQEWRDSLPLKIRPESPILCSAEHFIPVLIMHFVYLNALTTVHRILYQHGPWGIGTKEIPTSERHNLSIDPQFYASHGLCLAAARNTVQLLEYYTHKKGVVPRDGLIMMALEFPVIACLTLFVNTLQYPRNTHAQSDVKSMKAVAAFITSSMVPNPPTGSEIPLRILGDLVRVAEDSVQKATEQDIQKTELAYGEAFRKQKDVLEKEKSHSLPTAANSGNPNDRVETPPIFNNPTIPMPSVAQFNGDNTTIPDNLTASDGHNMYSAYNFAHPDYVDTLFVANTGDWDFAGFWDPNGPTQDIWGSEMAIDPDIH